MLFSRQSSFVAAVFDRGIMGWISATIVAGFLLLGWWPFEPFPPNNVTWLAEEPGLGFRPQGMAYDERALLEFPGGTAPAVFTIELSLEAALEPYNNVYHILTIHNGQLPSPFVLCQWKSHLVIRVPDASKPRGFREAAVEALQTGTKRNIAIVSSAAGTIIYVDGKARERYPHYLVPAAAVRGQLVLGNAASGKHSWSGKIFRLALYDRALAEREVSAPATSGAAANTPVVPGLVVDYRFTEKTGGVAFDRSANHHQLTIPPRYHVLQTPVLAIPRRLTETLRAAGMSDVIVNFIGFVPFGLVYYQYRNLVAPGRWWLRILLVTFVGAAVSLTIELGQVWLPTRDSSAFDLALNASGTFVGALFAAVAGAILVRAARVSSPWMP
jgi:hypothetical protein